MKGFKQAAGLFFVGGAGYAVLEVLWRGYTHWSMALTGGLVFVGLWLLDARLRGAGLFARCLAGTAWVTTAEFLVGISVNLGLRLDVWDYSGAWGNILGQVCPAYAGIWFLLCGPAMAIARSSANLLANPVQNRYNARSNMPEMRSGNHADRNGHREQPRTVWRLLRRQLAVRRLDRDRRAADRGTVRL